MGDNYAKHACSVNYDANTTCCFLFLSLATLRWLPPTNSKKTNTATTTVLKPAIACGRCVSRRPFVPTIHSCTLAMSHLSWTQYL